MKSTYPIIAFFAKRHLLTNLVYVAVIVGGIFAWRNTSKEELPDITFDTIRIAVHYPGAPASDVEFFVSKPIEEAVRGLDGVQRVLSTSSVGSANLSVEMEPGYPNFDEALAEVRNAVSDVDLPEEVIDDPNIRVFKTSKKAILDIALIHKDHRILDIDARRKLQKVALALENQLTIQSEIHSVTRDGYLQEELQIKIHPEKLLEYEIPFNAVMQQIRANNIRHPAGTLETESQPKVTLLSELRTPEVLRQLVVQGGFSGQMVRLGDVADVEFGYEKSTEIQKVNGHEAIMFNVVKNSSCGILDALDASMRVVQRFEATTLQGSPVQLVLLDDESVDVRNRLRLISVNGAIGFVMILITLLIFLNLRAGFWVAMGIPFTFCLTMIVVALMGYTINGITLAAVIIVMGIVVDDAIVVSENITRLIQRGVARAQAVVEGTAFVMLPITASILTTIVAFVPLFFFHGRYGRMIEFIPPIIFVMLAASLLESLFILPGHMDFDLRPHSTRRAARAATALRQHWFSSVERLYAVLLRGLLKVRPLVLIVFLCFGWHASQIWQNEMSFVMFPDEETRDIVLSGRTADGTPKFETARQVEHIENLISPLIGSGVVGYRTDIARSRRGSAVEENVFRITIEIVPAEQRKRSADDYIALIQSGLDGLDGFEKLRFSKRRFGADSGSPIEIVVQQNDDAVREQAVNQIAEAMRAHPDITNVELERNLLVEEFRVAFDRETMKRLLITPGDVVSTFRAALEGTILYEFSTGDDDIRVRLTLVDDAKRDIQTLLEVPVENRNNYLVSLKNIVSVERIMSPNAISRRDGRRVSQVFADMQPDTVSTPVLVAEDLEARIFPSVLAASPSTALFFDGEVRDTRESSADFANAIVLVLVLIYIVLAVLFNSLWKPLLIMFAIPFGLVGIIVAFHLHGRDFFGFYAAVGALGVAGVVVNDAIVMIVKLDSALDMSLRGAKRRREIADIASTRLRAVVLTTLTTVAGVVPTAYGFAGFDAMLGEMMLALVWGLIFGSLITLVLIPMLYAFIPPRRLRENPDD